MNSAERQQGTLMMGKKSTITSAPITAEYWSAAAVYTGPRKNIPPQTGCHQISELFIVWFEIIYQEVLIYVRQQ